MYQKIPQILFFLYFGFFRPRDPENRVPRAILRREVDGELRRMIFNRCFDKLRKKMVHGTFWFTTIHLEAFNQIGNEKISTCVFG